MEDVVCGAAELYYVILRGDILSDYNNKSGQNIRSTSLYNSFIARLLYCITLLACSTINYFSVYIQFIYVYISYILQINAKIIIKTETERVSHTATCTLIRYLRMLS